MTGIEAMLIMGKPVVGPASKQAWKLWNNSRHLFLKELEKGVSKTNIRLARAERRGLTRAYYEDGDFREALLASTDAPSEGLVAALTALLTSKPRSEAQVLDYADAFRANFLLLDDQPLRIVVQVAQSLRGDLHEVRDTTDHIKATTEQSLVLIRAMAGAPAAAQAEIKTRQDYRHYLNIALRDQPGTVRATIRASTGDSVGPASKVLPQALSDWPFLAVVAKGGAGKTTQLRALALSVLAQGDEVIYLNLKNLTDDARRRAKEQTLDLPSLVQLSAKAVSVSTSLDLLIPLALQSQQRVVWMLDGLNELTRDVAETVLGIVQAAVQPTHALVVSDREARSYKNDQWRIVTLQEIEPSEAAEVLDARFGTGVWESLSDKRQEVLRLPFFLNLALQATQLSEADSASGAIGAFLEEVAGLTEPERNQVSELVMTVYQGRGTGVVTPEQVATVGLGTVEKLLLSGTLLAADGNFEFRHQLLMDYFVACALSVDLSRWSADTFDAVSLDANSLDALLFVTDMLNDLALVDQYLTELHDWNWNATTKCLAALGKTHAEHISDGIVLALWAMVAAKQFDSVVGSSQRAHTRTKELDEVFSAQFVLRLADATSMIEVVDRLSPIVSVLGPQGGWFAPWHASFKGELDTPSLIARTYNSNPLLGWAAANALRRRILTQEEQQSLRAMYEAALVQSDPLGRSVRWRAIHAMAETGSADNVFVMLTALDSDAYSWVKYGAVRGLVEIAARGDAIQRAEILEALTHRLTDIPNEPVTQLFWAAQHADAPPDWPGAVRPLLLDACRLADGLEQDRLNAKYGEFEAWAAAR
jgi:hypothetical protein